MLPVCRSDEDLQRWEALYNGGGSKSSGTSTWNSLSEEDIDFLKDEVPVKVVSFDLDDTLWPTSEVMSQANAALHEHLKGFPTVVEAMGTDSTYVSTAMKKIHSGRRLSDPSLPESAVNLTELRTEALRLLAQSAGMGAEASADWAASSFRVWANARHKACEEHMFPGTLETMEKLSNAGMILGSITNGNADISALPSLRRFFAFAVTSEAIGEAKPARAPFEAAIRAAGLDPETVRGSWVHVGDDFEKDCAPAKSMRLRTIWVRARASAMAASLNNAARNADDDDGAGGGFLEAMLIRDFVDASVASVAEVGDIVLSWDSLAKKPRETEDEGLSRIDLDISSRLAAEKNAQSDKVATSPTSSRDHKFCIECGTKIQRVAKFCSECGTRLIP